MANAQMELPTYLGKVAKQLYGTSPHQTHSLTPTCHPSVTAAAVAESAASRKETKYATLSTTRIFIPIALESLGPIGSKATSFLKELGRRLSVSTDNPMETAYLFQRVSVAIQRFNAVCVLGCFSSQQDDT
jgi:hypothetical protein